MTFKEEFKGTQKEMEKLRIEFNVRHFVRIDIDRFIVEVRVAEDFILGKVRTLKSLSKRLHEHKKKMRL